VPRVLVIDDEYLVRTAIEAILQARGYEVVSAHNGGDGLAQLRQRQFDVVVTDLTMPEMTGIETIRAIRAQPAPPWIVAMSGGGRNQRHDLLAMAREIGADRSLNKPFTPAELLQAIDQATAPPDRAQPPQPETSSARRCPTGSR
jgi:CheY-like chemotaxis protein